MVLLPDLSWYSWLVLLRVSVGDLMALEDVATYLGELFPFGKQRVHFLDAVGILRFVQCGRLQGRVDFAKVFLVVGLDVVSERNGG